MQGGMGREYSGLVWRGVERNKGRGSKCEENREEGEMSDEVERRKGVHAIIRTPSELL